MDSEGFQCVMRQKARRLSLCVVARVCDGSIFTWCQLQTREPAKPGAGIIFKVPPKCPTPDSYVPPAKVSTAFKIVPHAGTSCSHVILRRTLQTETMIHTYTQHWQDKNKESLQINKRPRAPANMKREKHVSSHTLAIWKMQSRCLG